MTDTMKLKLLFDLKECGSWYNVLHLQVYYIDGINPWFVTAIEMSFIDSTQYASDGEVSFRSPSVEEAAKFVYDRLFRLIRIHNRPYDKYSFDSNFIESWHFKESKNTVQHFLEVVVIIPTEYVNRLYVINGSFL